MANLDYLESEFRTAKKKALKFIDKFNDKLPTDRCPACHSDGHVPGLFCPEATCGYIHPVSWVLLLDTEFGYDIVSLNNRRHCVASFNVDEDTVDPFEGDPGDVEP